MLAVYPAIAARHVAGLLPIGVVAMVLLAAALATGWPGGIPLALTLLGAEFVISAAVQGKSLVFVAGLYGSLLLAMAEIAYWALDAKLRYLPSHGLVRHRLLILLLSVGAALVIALIAGLAARAPVSGSIGLTAIAVASALLAFGFVALLAGRYASPPATPVSEDRA